jgi:hypothetical protein
MLGVLEAHAQRADEPRIPSDIGLRRDSRLQAHDWGELRLLKALSEVDWKLTLGVAYTHAENGDQVTSTPFQLRARFNEGRTAFKLAGSGYVHVRSEDRSTSGFNDVNVMMTQLVARDLIAEGGVTVPAGGEIGSSNGRKRVGAIYNHVFSPRWEGQLHGRLTHYDGDPRPGAARLRNQGLAQVAYNLDTPRSDVLFQLLRSYRRASTSGTSAALVYEFPLEQKRRPPMAAVSFVRGLTSGAHDNTVEFDLSLRF